ncbi:MAG: phosphodiester glycosidase family protein [Leptolyngbyaceae cyanobacterium bins.349]|nr:phosphodiester glycosidase family protein [Leptolyngbyaceae cyanobacterium bins.349]
MLNFSRLLAALVWGGWVSGAIAPAVAFGSMSPPPILTQQSPVQQGNQIVLNGRVIAGAWRQWAGANSSQVGISDAVLVNAFGVQLLNTDVPSRQPIQWFTPNNQIQNLTTQLSPTLRYLDVSDLARQSGWQLRTNGPNLEIATPATRIVGLRQSQQPWGDRLVLELNQPTPWQTNQRLQELQLVLEAQIDPTLSQQFKPVAGRFLNTIALEPSGNQTRLRFNMTNASARVWSVAAPNRIVIDIRPDALTEQNILWAPGLHWRQQIVSLGATRIPTVWLEVNPRQPGIVLQPLLPTPGTMTGIAPLLQTARQAQVAAAINGGFFNRNRQLPLGAIRLNGEWLSGPILNRGAIAWDHSGNVLFSRLTLQETVVTPTGQRLPLTHLNSGYVQAGIARYTAAWGPFYTALSDGEIVVVVQNNQVTSQQVLEQAGTASPPIPVNGYLLVLRSNRSATSVFPPGAVLKLESTANQPDFLRYPHVLGAGPLLLQNQQIVLDAKAESFSNAFAIETASRSAIAQRADGRLLLVTAHARLDGGGLSLMDMAQLLLQLGAVNALNLDGGSSTTLYLGGQIRDRPAGTAARVHNGFGIFLKGNP